ncbi:hypothetical protein ERO13_A13G057400v2 [Gossypium hirsutum]|uniref:Uncharacterized protein n=2 Tax=Gossypium TaxID=3633 RepID=A0A5D2WGN6_GOSMU|nr:hypothetical protein ERO13_A13G057400v2 [Gossypium hirsutum]TYH90674.1 hypothetical protein ES332_A13G065300v1 [Gossypium tomentosum]TYJ00071.1 hypothetical protein E1A91_A13G062400v1 [Gossypium mustelinum]
MGNSPVSCRNHLNENSSGGHGICRRKSRFKPNQF